MGRAVGAALRGYVTGAIVTDVMSGIGWLPQRPLS